MLGKYIAIFSTLNLSTWGSVDLRGASKVYAGCRANYEMAGNNLNTHKNAQVNEGNNMKA
jgi:hypothetical protein